MAGIINTGSFAKDLLPGVNKWFGESYDEFDTKYDKIFEIVSSNRSFEEDVLFGGLGLAQVKSEGAKIKYDSMNQGYTKRYTHVVYANGFIVTREMMDDGQADVVGRNQSRELALSMNQTREIICANVLNNGFDSNYTGGDGKELFARDHPTDDADLANEPATPADLSEASLEQDFQDIWDYKNKRGLRMEARVRKLIIPPAYSFEAHRILNSVLRVGVADNDPNAIRDMGLIPEGICVNHFLTDSDAYFLKTSVSDGLKYFNRRPVEVGIDNDFDTENAKFKSTMRFAVGWSDPRGCHGNPGAA